MSWIAHHSESEQFAAQAEAASRLGHLAEARRLYALAAEAEQRAIQDLDSAKVRTFGISAVSAVALLLEASDLRSAENAAGQWLSSPGLPAFARQQLRELLQDVWNEEAREAAGVRFTPGQVTVSIAGGKVVRGGAPLDLIIEKIQTVQAIFYRTAELLHHLPYRTQGPPPAEIRASCQPWLFQAIPGSYQFAVAIQEPPQGDMFVSERPSPVRIASRFLEVLRASSDSPEEALPQIVSDESYRHTFLKLTRNLSPTGKSFSAVEIKAPTLGDPVSLSPHTRIAINAALNKRALPFGGLASGPDEVVLTGLLRALHLDKDWIEVLVDGELVSIHRVGEAVDDVIGPMVNRPVSVRAVQTRPNHFIFRDIEPTD
jgi:hypothetical protein